MSTYIKKWKLLLSGLLVLAFIIGAQSGSALADCTCSGGGTATGSSSAQVLCGVGQTGANCSGSGVTNAVSAAVTILSIVVGVAAVIMIIISGFRYITSGGDATKVSGAKSALIYALVGIAIAALAQLLVHFVLYQSNQAL